MNSSIVYFVQMFLMRSGIQKYGYKCPLNGLSVPESLIQLNDRRVIQLSTAVRSISKSPYIVRDFIKIERGKWNLGMFHFRSPISDQQIWLLIPYSQTKQVIIHLDAISNYFDKKISSICSNGHPKISIDFVEEKNVHTVEYFPIESYLQYESCCMFQQKFCLRCLGDREKDCVFTVKCKSEILPLDPGTLISSRVIIRLVWIDISQDFAKLIVKVFLQTVYSRLLFRNSEFFSEENLN